MLVSTRLMLSERLMLEVGLTVQLRMRRDNNDTPTRRVNRWVLAIYKRPAEKQSGEEYNPCENRKTHGRHGESVQWRKNRLIASGEIRSS